MVALPPDTSAAPRETDPAGEGAAVPLLAATVIDVLGRHPAGEVEAALRNALLLQVDRPTRLVTARGTTAALDAILAHARALRAASEPPAETGLAELETALAAASGGSAPAVREAEVLAWRTAWLLAKALGGPLADDTLLARLELAVLADADRFYQRLTPTDPSYATLGQAIEEYRALARAAPSERVVGRTARWRSPGPGDTTDAVASLRARLAEVGFPTTPESGPRTFDAQLRGAFLAFQGRFGLEQSGLPSLETLDALAVPLSERVGQIGAVLDHLRRSRARLHPDRLMVNIPAFELRHFVGDRLDSFHRVVVGSIGYRADESTGRAGRLNLTPTLESAVRALVLNPSWSVPQRIKENELDRSAARDPDFYDGYDLWVDSRGVERARQRPGPRNALGRVKFVFDGGDGIYLHDTPLQRGFDKRVRTLSHGCVRVQEALALAQRVMEVDGHPTPWARARAILAGRRETELELVRPLPIFIEYLGVGADQEGALRFYPDVYGWGVVRGAEQPAAP